MIYGHYVKSNQTIIEYIMVKHTGWQLSLLLFSMHNINNLRMPRARESYKTVKFEMRSTDYNIVYTCWFDY